MKYPLVCLNTKRSTVYLKDLKEYLVKNKPLNPDNFEPFLKIHQAMFKEGGLFFEHYMDNGGKIYLDGVDVGFLGDPKDNLLLSSSKYLTVGEGSDLLRITVSNERIEMVRKRRREKRERERKMPMVLNPPTNSQIAQYPI
jgi:hypothetical protein